MSRLILAAGVVLLLLVAVVAGIWWFLFGANKVDSAELVPSQTIMFASIPNGTSIALGYETSHLKQLFESPNAKPLFDGAVDLVGTKNLELIESFSPNLSGQSFVALTRYDPQHPEKAGLVAAMKPKAGFHDFDSFLAKLKARWPEVMDQGKVGHGTVDGIDYDSIQGPGALDKICVARVGGWIVTTWGDAALQDWIERYQHKSTTPSLAQNPDYQKSIARVGKDAMTLIYLNFPAVQAIVKSDTNMPPLGGIAATARFEKGDIVDRVSLLLPKPQQIALGLSADPCSFDTLKFTGPNTRFYWATSINWKQFYKHLQAEAAATTPNFIATYMLNYLQGFAAGANIDVQHNIVDALGPEISLQGEWNPETTYPELGLFIQVAQPNDFQPMINAIIDTTRKTYSTSAVINELDSNGQKFATLNFIQAGPLTPTITEGGPYFGMFTTANQGVRSYQRDPSLVLTNNANFTRQTAGKRDGASQILFLDTPNVLDRAYQTAMPYLSIASMFNKDVAAALRGHQLPPDLKWLAPVDTWTCITTPDDDGLLTYSISGVGNQGIILDVAGAGTAFGAMRILGFPNTNPPNSTGTVYVPGTPPVPSPFDPFAALHRRPGIAALPRLPQSPVLNPTAPGTNQGPLSIITITADNKVFFDKTPMDPSQITDFLRGKKAAQENIQLVVNADKNSSPDLLATVMQAGASAGFGVLPHDYTSGTDSLPPTNAPAAQAPETNAVPSTNAAPVPSSPPADSNAATAPAAPAPATSFVPAAANPEAAPATPAPTTNAAPATNSSPDASPSPSSPAPAQ